MGSTTTSGTLRFRKWREDTFGSIERDLVRLSARLVTEATLAGSDGFGTSGVVEDIISQKSGHDCELAMDSKGASLRPRCDLERRERVL